MTGVIGGVVTPKDKSKSTPLLIKKLGPSQNLWLVLVLPTALGGAFTPIELPALKHGRNMNRGNKSKR